MSTPPESVVYFVAAPEVNRVKIGRSRDAGVRFGTLQQASPSELTLLGVIPDGNREREIHERFGSCRVRGEWFILTPELADFIKRNTELYRPPQPAPADPPDAFIDIDPADCPLPQAAIEAIAGLLLDAVDTEATAPPVSGRGLV